MTKPQTEGGAFLLNALSPDIERVVNDDVLYRTRH